MVHGDFKDLTGRTYYCVIKDLILLKIQNMKDIKGILLQWLIKVLIKKFLRRVQIHLQEEQLK